MNSVQYNIRNDIHTLITFIPTHQHTQVSALKSRCTLPLIHHLFLPDLPTSAHYPSIRLYISKRARYTPSTAILLLCRESSRRSPALAQPWVNLKRARDLRDDFFLRYVTTQRSWSRFSRDRLSLRLNSRGIDNFERERERERVAVARSRFFLVRFDLKAIEWSADRERMIICFGQWTVRLIINST